MKNLPLLIVLTLMHLSVFPQEENCQILENSLHGLRLIEDEWNTDTFSCLPYEKFVLVKQFEESVIAISVDDSGDPPYTFYFYEIDLDGNLVNGFELENADYSLDSPYNLQFKDGIVYFFVSTESMEEFAYNLEDASLSSDYYEVIDWESVLDGNWLSEFYFPSPSGKYQIELQDPEGHESLILKDLTTQQREILISQSEETWTFGSGFWKDEDIFYFDNSGPGACIWELNLSRKTIKKIVPDHEASKPILFSNGRGMKIMYILDNCIMIAKPKWFKFF